MSGSAQVVGNFTDHECSGGIHYDQRSCRIFAMTLKDVPYNRRIGVWIAATKVIDGCRREIKVVWPKLKGLHESIASFGNERLSRRRYLVQPIFTVKDPGAFGT